MTATPAPVSPLRWGILSTGRIAGVFARALAVSRHGQLVAVGSRSAAEATRFAAEHGLPPSAAHPTYDALLADPAVEAVYIATPHPQHVEWTERAAAAGKHVLCEKPAALDLAGTTRMVAAARAADVLFMEAFMYRCHPQTARVVELVRSGAIGRLRHATLAFGFRAPYSATGRLWSRALGGGGILDVGCYPMSFARLLAGAAAGLDQAAEPVAITGTADLHPETGVDAVAGATVRFADGFVAQLTAAIGVATDNTARLFGERGRIEIDHPWILDRRGGPETIRLWREGATAPEMITTTAGDLYALEADAFAETLRAGRRAVPAMTPEDTLGNLAALDAWRAAVGLRYPHEMVVA